MRRNTFTSLFFIKKTKLMKNGEAPIRLRVTVNGIAVESQIKRTTPPNLWDQATETIKSRDKRHTETNEYIRMLKLRILTIHRELELNGSHFTARIILDKLYNCDTEKYSLISIFKKHNEDCRKLIGIDYVDITVRRYECCARYLEELIKKEYRQDDIMLKDLNSEFVRKFEAYMKIDKKCQQNTVIRYMKCFKKIIHLAIANEWMSKNPFAGIKFHEVQVNKELLSMDEIALMMKKEFQIERLNITRDIFIFQVFTGLAFIDVYHLRKEHIYYDNNGAMWIRKTREKTDNMCNIPLLNIPIQILEKYADNPVCNERGVLLPVLSNQKMNSYLKEIADFCGIKKNLTTHTARHTFASVIALANNVSLPNVAKMLGHSNTRMTQHYAKVMDSSILRDMENVEKSLTLKID